METTMRHALIGLLFTSAVAAAPAQAQVSFSIGINVPAYPSLVPIPNYPVYYAPNLGANYFFYDGLYWVFANDTWYESTWYNGPWYAVDPYNVPVYLLRVPVRYYHVRPAYFSGWSYDAAPRWGSHWGHAWESRRAGWDRWDRHSAPTRAPLPTYQRSYSGNRYPRDIGQQASIQTRSYSYTPRDQVARTRFAERRNEARTVSPAQPSTQQGQRQQVPQQRTQQFQAQRQQERTQQSQAQQVERQQARAQQAQAQQAQRYERQQEAQQQRGERQQQHENRGEGRGRGRDRDNG
jgi:hypothetical protein